MKDLKHLYYFEKLLEDANNELVRQAQSEGLKCIATTCENVPEPLLNLPGIFSVRLRAPRTGSMEMATYYMTSFLCEYSRALLERAIEGGYNFVDGIDHARRQSPKLTAVCRPCERFTGFPFKIVTLQRRPHFCVSKVAVKSSV